MDISEQLLETDAGLPVVVLQLSGSLDFSADIPVTERIDGFLAQSRNLIVLDLSDVAYASSGGLGLLLKSAKHVQEQGGRMAVCNPQPMVAEILNLTKLSTIITVTSTQTEAIDDVSKT